MQIKIATSDDDIVACYPLMRELRPHVPGEQFLFRVRAQEAMGYRLVFADAAVAGLVALAGFRLSENLAWGRFLYVDDLVTHSEHRSKGYGTTLLSWLKDYAVQAGCLQFHLDSGIQRKDAHRFYKREGLQVAGYHFSQCIAPSAGSRT